MNDGHELEPVLNRRKRCKLNWPCPAEQQWQDIRDKLQQTASAEAELAELKLIKAE